MRQLYTEHSSPEFLEQAVQELTKPDGRFLAPFVPETSQADPETLSHAVRELVPQVPWGHHVELKKMLKDPAARLYHLCATAQCGWRRSVLLNQIKAGAYERAVKEKRRMISPIPHAAREG
jgi:hypothetical protein